MTNLDCLPLCGHVCKPHPVLHNSGLQSVFVSCVKTSLISPSWPSHLPYAKAQQPNQKNHKPHSQCCMSPPEQVMATNSQSPPETNLSTAIKVHSESDPVPTIKWTLNQDTLNKQSDISALANKHNPEARTIPFPKKYVCCPGLSTILNSQSLSSQSIPPIETNC